MNKVFLLESILWNETKLITLLKNKSPWIPKRASSEPFWRRSRIFIVNSEHVSHLVLVFLLLILNM